MAKPTTENRSGSTLQSMERRLSGGEPLATDLLLQRINEGLLDPSPDEDLPSSQLAQEISALIRGGLGTEGQTITPIEAVRLISTANARLRRIGIKKPSDAAYGALPEGDEIPF